ncbi:MAG: methyltransferase domain-containing protein [Nitrospirae bacterium]|nr:methyltransferase domain-containing protein [Nitrospirota bacterium]
MKSEEVQKVYNNYASIYDVLFGIISEEGRMSAIKQLQLNPGDKVLEVGVGTGLSLPLYPTHCHVTGIDLSENMLTRAKKRIHRKGLSHITIERMDATSMTFSENSFDSVYAAYLISVVPDPYGVLSEIKRVCRKGGTIVVVNHFKSSNKLISSIETSISPFCSKHLGFRTDLCISFMLNDPDMKLLERRRLSPISLWEIAVFRNLKGSKWI